MWRDSNSNYGLRNAVIEKVSEQTCAQSIEAAIFDCPGMSDTAVDDKGSIAGRASGYRLAGGQTAVFHHAGRLDMSALYAAGAIRSTVEDLARWDAALHGGSRLSASSLAQMTEPGLLRDGVERPRRQ